MFEKRHRITLLFNANKAYDRQVVEGVGEYLQATQSSWDIFIEEDFRARIDNIKEWLGDGVIADYDDKEIEKLLADVDVPIVGVGGSYHSPEHYPPVHYIATDNYALVEQAFLHLKEKGVHRFAFYGLPPSSGKRWAAEREHAFCQLVAQEKYRGVVYQGLETAPDNWQHAQNRLADWLQTLPPQTGIIAVTDARARHVLQVCEHLHIPVPEKICVIGIDNEELTRYLSRVALSSVAQGTRQMGYQAAKLLHRLLAREPLPLQRLLSHRSKSWSGSRRITVRFMIRRSFRLCITFVTMPARELKSNRYWMPLACRALTLRNALKKKWAKPFTPFCMPRNCIKRAVCSFRPRSLLMRSRKSAVILRCSIFIRSSKKSMTPRQKTIANGIVSFRVNFRAAFSNP